jgi:hypothetical protein
MTKPRPERPHPAIDPPTGPCRFVVLKHSTDNGDHYDLMMQWEGSDDPDERTLKTWATVDGAFPAGGSILSLSDDHRQHYLDYEGPVGRPTDSGRFIKGQVTREDAGIFRVLDQPVEGLIAVLFMGRKLRGRFVFEPYAWGHRIEQVKLRKREDGAAAGGASKG